MNNKSIIAFKESNTIFPGGVNSPVRAFPSLSITPPFIDRGEGAYLYDIDGNKYIDYVLSWGPLVLGHCHPQVNKAISEQMEKGVTYGAPTLLESKLGQTLKDYFPFAEQLRFVNSGTEATMSAVRLARGYTKRDTIVKFNGCYHGHADSFLVEAGSGLATFGTSSSKGVPDCLARLTISLPYNDIEAVREVFEQKGDSIAAVIVEPVAGNMGLIPGKKNFLLELRKLTKEHHSLLIFDEVMSGFRASYPGASSYYGIDPDIITFGKVIGGGLNVAAYASSHEIMSEISPCGGVYQAGTLSGNPLGMAAGFETVTLFDEKEFEKASKLAGNLCEGIKKLSKEYEVPMQVHHLGTMFSFFFNDKSISNFSDAESSNQKSFNRFFEKILSKGIYFGSSQYETNFISTAHTQDDIDYTLMKIEETLIELAEED